MLRRKIKLSGQPFYGWSGNKTNEVEQFFENAVMLKNSSSIISTLLLRLNSVEANDPVEIKERKFRYPDGKCFDIKIKIDPDFNRKKNVDLRVAFNEVENIEKVNIKITDPNREYFLSDMFTFSGKEIKKSLDLAHEKTLDVYKVQIHESIELEEDAEAGCKIIGRTKTKASSNVSSQLWRNNSWRNLGACRLGFLKMLRISALDL